MLARCSNTGDSKRHRIARRSFKIASLVSLALTCVLFGFTIIKGNEVDAANEQQLSDNIAVIDAAFESVGYVVGLRSAVDNGMFEASDCYYSGHSVSMDFPTRNIGNIGDDVSPDALSFFIDENGIVEIYKSQSVSERIL